MLEQWRQLREASARQHSVVRLVGVTRDFGSGIVALRDVHLSLDNGMSYAVTGPSGSGKSTLLNIIGLLDRPTSGQVLIHDQDVSRASDKERAAVRGITCGFVFQDFHLLPHRSTLENIMLGGYYTGRSRKHRAAQAMKLAQHVGLEHRATQPVNKLSGGERQRVAIARALMNTPSLLLCDEPTGNLDSQASQKIMELLLSLATSITLVVVTHDPVVAGHCQQIIEVFDGRVNTP
jgi:ABC-type lipoprotein export system ATPase subunit